ncbi:4-hydroxyacetophenone monooxygenase [Talaromyces islandicus]|uniref:4-hydroxyacetophenone monooxygenase n=1 Tax=Talaromyces islandicus TaxID=28573 RepID=A0A0U1LNP6_TALIS|nr:4-hydroxyacetophenone monooxygenase [Talaromyces islandicus]
MSTYAPKSTCLDRLPCIMPSRNIPEDVDAPSICKTFTSKIDSLEKDDFVSHAIWRDFSSLTGTLRTLYSADFIHPTWRGLCCERQVMPFQLSCETAHVVRPNPKHAWITVPFTFAIKSPLECSCLGYLNLIPGESGDWKIWVMCTMLDQLCGYANVDQLDPIDSYSFCDEEQHDSASRSNEIKQEVYDCVVIGAGQAGLSMAGRLKALGVSYICIESNNKVGDSWRLRYDSARLHTVREYGHLPFERTFTPDYPQWLTKDDLAKGFSDWAKKFGINILLSTTVGSGSWDESKREWTLHLQRRSIDGEKIEKMTITSSNVVLGVGGGCLTPLFPKYENEDKFKGHDVAEDMVNAGLASVTMIQRGKTLVIPIQEYKKISELLYNADTPTTISDIRSFLRPFAVSRKLGLEATRAGYIKNPDKYAGLLKAGFLLDREEEITRHLNDRFGGHYLDVGASKMIADGLIKMKSGSLPVSYTEDGLLFADGSHLKADVVVFTTGFRGNMRDSARQLFGDEVADRADDYWGINPEGEIKGAFKPTGQPGLWYIGGGIGHSRFFSRFIAMQIKAELEGRKFPIFNEKQPNIWGEI